MKRELKGFIMGAIAMALIFSLALTGFAAPVYKTITATFNNIKIYADGTLIQLKDSKGNNIEPFMYNGITYVPLETMGQAFKKPVQWDSKTNSIYIGNKTKAITLNFSESDDLTSGSHSFWDDIIKSFSAKYPNIIIKRTHATVESQRSSWQNQVAYGEGPHVISCPQDNVGLFTTAGTVMQLDSLFSKSFYDRFDKKIINDSKLDGKTYAIPYEIIQSLVLIYNKRFVKEPPKTMDELVKVSKSLTNSQGRYGLVFNMAEPYFYIPFLGGFGGQIFDSKGNFTLNSEAMKKTAQFMYDLKFKHKIVPKEANYDIANGLFKDGRAGFIINGTWAFEEYKDAGMNFGIAKIPQVPGGKWSVPFYGSKVFMVNPNITDTDTKNAVRTFIEYLNTPEIQLRIVAADKTHAFSLPTHKDALNNAYVQKNPTLKVVWEQISVGTTMPPHAGTIFAFDAMKPVFKDVMDAKVKPEQAPAIIQKKAIEIYASILGN
ncbi:MAG: extracellular solute-binding protein [Clostridia bacterium]|nr:extracellular solute-binding protein [Clostridia bacterium]